MAITLIADSYGRSVTAVDIIAIHGLEEDDVKTWTVPESGVLWLQDLLPQALQNVRILTYSYKAAALKLPGSSSAESLLNYATNLVAELYAERQLDDASQRPIIFICHGFGGLLVKRALVYSSTRRHKAVEHLRSIYVCTYGILFLGTPHNGMETDALLSQNSSSPGPNHFLINLQQGSEMLNEISDQFAPLMKQFAIFNFWEELKSTIGGSQVYVVHQDSAAPGWDNVEKCGITADHSSMAKFKGSNDKQYRALLEALARYTRHAPSLIRSRLKINLIMLNQERQSEAQELLGTAIDPSVAGDTTPEDFNKWCMIPRRSSIYFTGRRKLAKEVRDMLGSTQKRATKGQERILVIYGLGGSGKTQFCLKYAEDNVQKYWGIFWIDASNEKNIESGFASIGVQAGLGGNMTAGMHWLSRSHQPWLLVLDNADDPEMDISAYCPSGSSGHVLITTRNPAAIEHATAGHIRFRGMEPFEGTSLLLKAAYPHVNDDAPPATPGRWQIAQKIAVELGYLPLALTHAGTAIRRNIYTLEKYLNYYLGRRKSMLSRQQVRSVEETDIITTWEIPFQRIAGRASTQHRDAVDLMHVFAFMHFETIPELIFQRSWEQLNRSEGLFKFRLGILQDVWSEEVEARVRRAIGVLCNYSIVEYERTTKSCVMHPVIHSWSRDRLSDAEQKQWLRCTMTILAGCISPYFELSGRSFRVLLLPHINACLQAYDSRHSPLPKTVECAQEIEKFAWIYAEQGRWDTARSLQKRVVDIRISKLGRGHQDTIRAQRDLGQTLWNLFDIKSAIELQLQVLNALRWRRPHVRDWIVWPVYKPTHVPYCVTLNELTLTLWLAGQRELSKMTGERAVDGLTRRLGAEDPITLRAMFNLARTYLHIGEDLKCRSLLLKVLRLQKRFFGMDHPDTLMTRNELGICLCASKRNLVIAQHLVENVLKARKKILGDEHAYTLWSINDLSKIYVERNRAVEAISLLENIIPVVIRTLGDDHVGMSMTRGNLGRAYYASERWEDAEATLRPLLTGIPPDHPDWIHTRYGLTHIRFNLGHIEETEKSCIELLDVITKKKGLSLHDSRTISVADLLLQVYRMQDRSAEMEAIKRKFPGVGTVRSEDRFDPYAIRKVSVSSLKSSKAEPTAARPRSRPGAPGDDNEGPSRNADPRGKQSFNVINRRTM